MHKYLYRFYVNTPASISKNRTEQQGLNLKSLVVKLVGTTHELRIFDYLVNDINSKLKIHAGLGIDVLVEADNFDLGKIWATTFTNNILNLITFSNLCECQEPKFISGYQYEDANLEREYCQECSAIENIVKLVLTTNLRPIDEDSFSSVFSQYNIYHSATLSRALEYLRKGVNSKHILDEFISYWVGLEAIQGNLNLLYPPNKQKLTWRYAVKQFYYKFIEPYNKPSEWNGIKTVFSQLGYSNSKFNRNRGHRGALIHGTDRAIYTEQTKELTEQVRKVLIKAISNILSIESHVAAKIINLTPARTLINPYIRIKSTIKNLSHPVPLEQIDSQPYLEPSDTVIKFEITPRDKMSAKVKMDFKTKIPHEAQFVGFVIEGWGDDSLKKVASDLGFKVDKVK